MQRVEEPGGGFREVAAIRFHLRSGASPAAVAEKLNVDLAKVQAEFDLMSQLKTLAAPSEVGSGDA